MAELIAYFSRPGENYVNGNIVNLEVGNTEIAAKMIQEITGARSEERRVGKECTSWCRSRWSPYH